MSTELAGRWEWDRVYELAHCERCGEVIMPGDYAMTWQKPPRFRYMHPRYDRVCVKKERRSK